ncbi:MAG: 1-hydroxy-2-isopentenylcarotenoid 3,4-desaturase [Patescibacteria group bacterium]|jgi:phytoene desaturase|nr:1-hydroxy-2-isopentenylcarotenoid 3,4-desaturase [Patescibacteria group bacterium]
MENTKTRVIIIGSGFGGLGLAAMLAKSGHEVTVLEKNESLGGRASVFREAGFTFDMGPSWYLMPDVFEHFFKLLGERVEDHLSLTRLAPSYRVFFKDKHKVVDLYSDLARDAATFESLEPGAGESLRKYLVAAKRKYEIGVGQFIYKNYDHFSDFLTREFLLEGWRLSVFSSMSSYVKTYFKDTDVQKMLQHTLLFLGNSPKNAPALYSMLSHVDLGQGVFYPSGGIGSVIQAIVKLGAKYGVTFKTGSAVVRIITKDGVATGVRLADGTELTADVVVSNADLHHTDTQLLAPADRERTEKYWNKRVMSPSAFILYLGLNKQFSSITHHNLVFSQDWDQNFDEIFTHPQLPTDPSFYVCAPSKTDPGVAPEGSENMFLLVPIASGMHPTQQELDVYEAKMLETMETSMGLSGLRDSIVVKRRFCLDDFSERYNSYRGSGLGLSHTLWQTAIFRPNTYSKKVKNLYFVGGNTNPGIGMPMCLVSAELVYKRLVGDNSGRPLNSLK